MSNTVAHGGDAAGYLGGTTDTSRSGFNAIRVVLVGLVRGEHVIVRRDDGDISRVHHLYDGFIIARTGSHAVSEIAAAELFAIRRTLAHGVNVTKEFVA